MVSCSSVLRSCEEKCLKKSSGADETNLTTQPFDVNNVSLRTTLVKAQNRTEGALVAIISLALSFLIMVVFIVLIGFSGAEYDIGTIIDQAFIGVIFASDGSLNTSGIALVIFWSAPLILTGLSVAVAFRNGLFNIGAQGQMMVGGVFAGIWAAAIVPQTEWLSFLNVWFLLIPSTIVVGVLGGVIWGIIPGLLRAYTGAHEVIVTIMMNNIAYNFTFYLVGSSNAPFVDKGSTSAGAYGQTAQISKAAQIPPLFPDISQNLNATFFLVVIVVFVMAFILWRTSLGYKIRAVGHNKTAAEAAGIDSKRTTWISFAFAGGLAGLAGVIAVIGVFPYRYVYGSEGTVGFDGIAVSLIGQNNPIPILAAALFFGFLTQGRVNLDQNTQIPPDLIFAVQALVILLAAAPIIGVTVYKRLIAVRDIDFSSDGLKDWLVENKKPLISSIIALVVFGVPLLLIDVLKIDLWDILTLFSPLTTLVGEVSLPFLAVAAFLLPFAYIGRLSYRFMTKESEVSRQKRIGKLLLIGGGLLEGFLLILYTLNFISVGELVNPVVFHLEIWQIFVSSGTFRSTLIAAIPIILAALGGTFNERAGVINIGLEGIMLFSAWGGVYFTYTTGDPFIGLVGGLVFGFLLALVHALFTITFKSEHVVTGVAINLIALGLTEVFTATVWQAGRSDSVKKLPRFLPYDLPIIGGLFEKIRLSNFFSRTEITLFDHSFSPLEFIPDPIEIIDGQSFLLLLGFLLIPVCHFVLFRTTFGLRLRVIGEEPQAAATAGIPVKLYQYIAVLVSGLLAALGGVFLSIGNASIFQSNVSGGRGYTALAAMIFGKWTAIGSALSGLFFGYFYALSIRLKFVLLDFPAEWLTALPFIVAILALAGAIGRARPPKHIGKPYDPTED